MIHSIQKILRYYDPQSCASLHQSYVDVFGILYRVFAMSKVEGLNSCGGYRTQYQKPLDCVFTAGYNLLLPNRTNCLSANILSYDSEFSHKKTMSTSLCSFKFPAMISIQLYTSGCLELCTLMTESALHHRLALPAVESEIVSVDSSSARLDPFAGPESVQQRSRGPQVAKMAPSA